MKTCRCKLMHTLQVIIPFTLWWWKDLSQEVARDTSNLARVFKVWRWVATGIGKDKSVSSDLLVLHAISGILKAGYAVAASSWALGLWKRFLRHIKDPFHPYTFEQSLGIAARRVFEMLVAAVLSISGAVTQLTQTQTRCTTLSSPAEVLSSPYCAAWLEPPFRYKDILHAGFAPEQLQVSPLTQLPAFRSAYAPDFTQEASRNTSGWLDHDILPYFRSWARSEA